MKTVILTHSVKFKLIAVIVVVILQSIFNSAPTVFAEIIHVPADYPTIRQAISAAARSGDEIIVAPGTYNEAINFSGKEIYLHSADGQDVTTIDATGLNQSAVSCKNGEGPGTKLEGFTITGGSPSGSGGGMFNRNCSATIIDCTFINNQTGTNTDGGAGIYNNYSNVTVNNCTFINNQTGTNTYGGAGIYNYYSNVTVNNCSFINNSVGVWASGGGIHNYYSSPSINNCTFTGNEGDDSGGGIYNYGGSPTINNCTFTNNSALGGGAILNANSSANISNCTFDNNLGYWLGGAIQNLSSHSTIVNCTFSNNTAQSDGDGGAIYASGTISSIITNCLFYNNTTAENGGAIACKNSPEITNCTFSYNSAGLAGGGIYSYNNAIITNCIIWGNSPSDVSVIGSTVTYSCFNGYKFGDGNINKDPEFVDAANGNLRLALGSPCIDAGNNEAISELYDLDGKPRFYDDPATPDTGLGTPPIVDMGCYEYKGPYLIIYPNPLIAGQDATFTVGVLKPNTKTYLAYSMTGSRSTYIPFLKITLDLKQPKQAGETLTSDNEGNAQWILHIPKAGSNHFVWLQACQYELKTNLVATLIEQ